MALTLLPPKKDLVIIIIVAVMISAAISMVIDYSKIPEEEYCWYDVKYLHVSGREITKPIHCSCKGFHYWSPGGGGFEGMHMSIYFANGEAVRIYGATDILSVAKQQK